MKKIAFIFAVALGVCLSSCSNWLDINENPNSPTESNIETYMLMPAIEMNIAASYGDYLRITGGYFSEVYAHLNGTSNYLTYSQFEQTASGSSSTYQQLYQRGLSNLQTLLEKASGDNDPGTYLAGTVLRAFTFQALVDCYGEVPYTEALDPGNTSPHYDDGQTVYEGILQELDVALSEAASSNTVCTNFLFPGENAGNWIKFANALKLKLLMRMSNVKNVEGEVAALIAEDNFPTADVAYTDCWGTSSTDMSPFYAEEFSSSFGSTQQNVCANLAIIGTMNQTDYQDPRLLSFFEPNEEEEEYVGGVSGTNYPGTDYDTKHWCRPVASATMPVYLITVAEVEYFIAEYYARYGSADQAEAHYKAAIEASFNTAGVDGAADHVEKYPYDNGNYKKCLGESKWVALSGINPFEGWCEMRRLDYPAFGTATGADLYNVDSGTFDTSKYVPFTLYTPIQVFGQVGNNHILERFPYAESSTARNRNVPDFPGYTSPVFWAK